jgi:hypothetical protein
MRKDVAAEVVRLLARKQADKYVTRSGGPPSLLDRQLAARSQDLLEDDRKALRYSIGLIKRALKLHPARDDNVASAFSFIEAVLDRDYGLSLGCDRDDR